MANYFRRMYYAEQEFLDAKEYRQTVENYEKVISQNKGLIRNAVKNYAKQLANKELGK